MIFYSFFIYSLSFFLALLVSTVIFFFLFLLLNFLYTFPFLILCLIFSLYFLIFLFSFVIFSPHSTFSFLCLNSHPFLSVPFFYLSHVLWQSHSFPPFPFPLIPWQSIPHLFLSSPFRILHPLHPCLFFLLHFFTLFIVITPPHLSFFSWLLRSSPHVTSSSTSPPL